MKISGKRRISRKYHAMVFDVQQAYTLIREVPKGEIASYGMIASLLPGVGPRQVARALSHMPRGVKAPWQRIVQSSGAIAERVGAERQRTLLRKEGITFRNNGAVDWKLHLWRGPSQQWIIENDFDPNDVMEIIASWGR